MSDPCGGTGADAAVTARKRVPPMPISTERLDQLAGLPDDAIDVSDISEANEAFFQAAKLRRKESGPCGESADQIGDGSTKQ